jgi:hypothetical protein
MLLYVAKQSAEISQGRFDLYKIEEYYVSNKNRMDNYEKNSIYSFTWCVPSYF